LCFRLTTSVFDGFDEVGRLFMENAGRVDECIDSIESSLKKFYCPMLLKYSSMQCVVEDMRNKTEVEATLIRQYACSFFLYYFIYFLFVYFFFTSIRQYRDALPSAPHAGIIR